MREGNSLDSVLQRAISINILFHENASFRKSLDFIYYHVSIHHATFQYRRAFEKALFFFLVYASFFSVCVVRSRVFTQR